MGGPQEEIQKARSFSDLRTCQDCGAKVPYLFSNREYVVYRARCGMATFEPRACPEGYVTDRGPYEAGVLEAMSNDRLMDELDRAYSCQASVVDNFGSDDASYKAEVRCFHVEAELKSRGLYDAYWARCDAEESAHSKNPPPEPSENIATSDRPTR